MSHFEVLAGGDDDCVSGKASNWQGQRKGSAFTTIFSGTRAECVLDRRDKMTQFGSILHPDFSTVNVLAFESLEIMSLLNRPGVVGAVLQTASV